MNLLRFFMLFALTLAPLMAHAQDDGSYVVSASRFTVPMNQVGYDVTIFTEEDLLDKQISTLDEALRLVPGITIAETGIGAASAFVRGGNSNALLILVDGIPVNDPTQVSLDMNSISIGSAERVEVVLGAQSAMYGAGALAGVVNIITKTGEGPLNGSVYLEGGYPLNGKLQANVNAGYEKFAYALALTGRYSNAISSTKNEIVEELDPFYDINFTGSVKYIASDAFNVRLMVNESYQNYNFDSSDTTSEDVEAKTLRSMVSLKPELILFDSLWAQSLNLSYIHSDRVYSDYDWIISDIKNTDFASQGVRLDWQHKIDLDMHKIALGAIYQYDQQIENGWAYDGTKGKFDVSNFAGYAEYSVNPINNLYLNASGRIDKYELFDLGLSGNAAIAYTLPSNTFLHASVGRGFAAPSIEQMSNAAFDKSVNPESSFTWDIGAKQKFGNIAQISVGYYNALYTNTIEFNTSSNTYYNDDAQRKSQGITAGIDVSPIESLSLGLSGTYEMTKLATGERPARVPDYTLSFDADYALPVGNNASVGLSVIHIADRDDIIYGSAPTYTNTETILDAYTLLNLRAQMNIIDDLTIYLKLNNLLNTEYEEVYGYSTLGFNANIGLRYTF